jgi:hypothetical protein
MGSRSFREHAGSLLLLLDHTTYPLPEWALDPCERYTSLEDSAIGDLATAAASHGYHLVKIVVRINAQHTDPDIRRRCLDLMDRLLVLGAQDVDEPLASIER